MKMKNDLFVIRTDDDSRLISVLCIMIVGLYIRNASYILTIFNTETKQAISIMIRMIILLFILFCIPAITHRINSNFIFLTIISALFIAFHILIFTENNSIFLDTLKTFVTTIFPGIICIYLIQDYDRLFDKFLRASIFISILNIGIFFLLILGKFAGSGYSMGFSQALIFPTNVIIANLYRTKKMKFFGTIFILLNSMTIVLFGSRGALVAIFIFLLLMMIKNNNGYAKSIGARITLLILLATAALVFADNIISGLIHLFGKMGISSRSLELLLQNNFFGNNGRLDIWRTIGNQVLEHPFKFRGINADQLLRTGFYNTSNYSHNLFLELFYSFGVIVGGILSIAFGIKFFRTYTSDISTKEGLLKLLLLSPFFPSCIWSGSLWTDMYCWLWIAFMSNLRKKERFSSQYLE